MPSSNAAAIEAYLAGLPPEREPLMRRLHGLILKALPPGFEAGMSYGMIGYAVPHRLYPAGYHCEPKLPLPFAGLASTKQHIAVHHMGLYSDEALMAWFQQAHAKASPRKLDLGKSCIRYKKPEDIPEALLAELFGRMSVQDWIARYEAVLKR